MRRAFVTGVNRGLGRELFGQLIARGYFVYGLLRDEAAFAQISAGLPQNAQLVLGDISKDDVAGKITALVKGPIDLLVNNAGISGKGIHLKKVKPSEVNDVFNVHSVGVLRVVQALEANLLEAANPLVVNISSRMGSITNQNKGIYKDLKVSYSYRMAKAAQNMLTSCLQLEFEGKINFVSLHPGRMKTRTGQVDANLEPSESARRIIGAWETGQLKAAHGIVELGANTIPW